MFEMNILSSSSWITPEVEDVPHVAAHALAQAAVQQVFGRKTIIQYRIVISWQCWDPEIWVNPRSITLVRILSRSSFTEWYQEVKHSTRSGYRCGDCDAMFLINPYMLFV